MPRKKTSKELFDEAKAVAKAKRSALSKISGSAPKKKRKIQRRTKEQMAKINLLAMPLEKAQEIRRMGAKASAEARREKKRIQEAFKILLEMEDPDTQLTGAQTLALAMYNKAKCGDVAAFCALRDTAGEIITQKQDISVERPQIIIGGIDTNIPTVNEDVNEDVIEAEVVKEIEEKTDGI